MSETGIGAAVRREDDSRFLAGNGRYPDDVKLPDRCYAYFVRSPCAHATFTISTTRAAKAPGVIAESLAQAKGAAELIEVDYQATPAEALPTADLKG